MVYYRKYRPQNISELDSDSLKTRLTSVLSGSLPHAFLFTGPKGLGKTSTARIVAKVVNCEKNSKGKNKKSETIEPCNECSQCVSITNGTNLDVLEIDAASNRGIDEIRDLRDKIRLAPVAAGKKVYIIDEVHMLTTEAFNALLKTLEEPPEHVIFILCTTELHKVPETIISRCTHVQFEKATTDDFIRSFSRIVSGENISIDKEVLVEIATMSDGSFRDGAKLLEEIVSFASGKKITKELINERFKTSTIAQAVIQMRSYFKHKKTTDALALVDSMVNQGVDVLYFLEKIIEDLHINLLVNAEVVKGEKSQEYLSFDELKPLVELLSKAYVDSKYAVVKQLPLELAVIEYTTFSTNLLPLANDTQTDNLKKTSEVARGPVTSSFPAGAPSSLASSNEVRAAGSPKARTTPRESTNILQELIETVKLQNQTVAGVLRGVSLKSYDEKKLLLETPFKFHKDRLDDKKTQELLLQVLTEITGKKIELEVSLKAGK